jgi:hypothetical protein
LAPGGPSSRAARSMSPAASDSRTAERPHCPCRADRPQRPRRAAQSWNSRHSDRQRRKVDKSGSGAKAVGEIENESNQALSNIDVEVILRDSAGNVLETGSALANDHSLAPGDSTTFSVLIRKRSEAKTASLSFRRYGINAKKYSHRVRN